MKKTIMSLEFSSGEGGAVRRHDILLVGGWSILIYGSWDCRLFSPPKEPLLYTMSTYCPINFFNKPQGSMW